MAVEPTERPARPGEMCTCGQPATVVYLTGNFDDVPYCGQQHESSPANPAPRIEDYRLTLARRALAEYHEDPTGLDAVRLARWCGRFQVVIESLIELAEQQAARR